MFDSSRFSGDNIIYHQPEYDSLAYATACLLIGTVVYFCIAVILHLALILCLRTVHSQRPYGSGEARRQVQMRGVANPAPQT